MPFRAMLCCLSLLVFPIIGLAKSPETVKLELPKGDPVAGRATFQELGCTSCHRVAGETEFAEPVSANPGPTLGGYQGRQSPARVALSIFAPSHEITATVRQPKQDGLSPMGDFTEAMTVREFLDLVAYIGSLSSSGGEGGR